MTVTGMGRWVLGCDYRAVPAELLGQALVACPACGRRATRADSRLLGSQSWVRAAQGESQE